VVILPDLARLREIHPPAERLPRPYFLCANMNMVEAGFLMIEQNEGYRGHDLVWLRPIFDSHEEYSGVAKLSWDNFRTKNPKASKYLLPIHYESEKEYLTLQAADNLAFEVRKIVTNLKDPRKLPVRKSFKRVVQAGSLVRLYIFDYDVLQVLADVQGSDMSEAELRRRFLKCRFTYPIKTVFHQGSFNEDE